MSSLSEKENQKSDFDFDRYANLLNTILEAVQEEHKQFSLDWRNRQFSILKTYLWLSITLIASQFAIFSKIWGGNSPLPWNIIIGFHFYFFAFFTLGTSTTAFCLGIYFLKGKDFPLPYDRSYKQMIEMAREESFISSSNFGILEKTMITTLEESLIEHRHQGTTTGKRLRLLSIILITSTLFFAMALLPWNL